MLILLLFLAPVTWFAWNFFTAWHYGQAFEKIRQGDSERRVVELMGKPSEYDFALPIPEAWDEEPTVDHRNEVTSQTIKVYWYGTPMFAQAYAIGFDHQGRAVTKYHYSSP